MVRKEKHHKEITGYKENSLEDNPSVVLNVAILKIQNFSSYEILGKTQNKITEKTPIPKLIILSCYTDIIEAQEMLIITFKTRKAWYQIH